MAYLVKLAGRPDRQPVRQPERFAARSPWSDLCCIVTATWVAVAVPTLSSRGVSMPPDAAEPPAELRIGRWLPAVPGDGQRPEDAPTVSVPALGGTRESGAETSARHDAPASPPPVPPGASPEAAPAVPPDVPPEAAPAVPPDDFAELPAPARRTRHLAVAAAITLVLAAVAAGATAVALQAKPSRPGNEAEAPPTLPTVVATSAEPREASPTDKPSPTGSPTPSATSPSPTATPSGGSPSATPVALDVSVEAEAPSTVLGGRTRIQAMAVASGGAVVSRIGGGAVHSVRFAPITVAESATYTLTIHYVSDATRRAVITINGATAAAVTCSASDRVGRVSVKVHLVAGPNTIEYGNDDASAPDLDRITLVS
ncbi:MAG TPA: hypothetical protein VF462_16915 [Micromonosporaceae bacterium]